MHDPSLAITFDHQPDALDTLEGILGAKLRQALDNISLVLRFLGSPQQLEERVHGHGPQAPVLVRTKVVRCVPDGLGVQFLDLSKMSASASWIF